MKKIILSGLIVLAMCYVLAGTSCFDATRDNPNDPKADNFEDIIYMFPTGTQWGNLGGRSGADTLCTNARTASYSSLPVTNIHAFLSVASGDEIGDMMLNYDVPADRIITGPTGKKIANNWNDLFDGIAMSLADAEILPDIGADTWWSGYGATLSSDRCDDWTNTGGTAGRIGSKTALTTQWLYSSSDACNVAAGNHVLCICWSD